MNRGLDKISSPTDFKHYNVEQLKILSQEIRDFLLTSVSQTGGHLGSNLGVVELTLALHYCFDSPQDKLIWDVGHQAYVHKIVTGRKDLFSTLRQLDGLSGFPKTSESCHDVFNTGHSSTSISAGLGFAKARDLAKEKYSVISIIGDGSLTGGMAFEALNNAGQGNTNLIVILNDNQMSISQNVGGLSQYLSELRAEPIYLEIKDDVEQLLNKIPGIGPSLVRTVGKAKGGIKYLLVPGILFEELGFTYLGPIDGHDLPSLINVFKRAKKMKGPVFIHVKTIKGKGYQPAEVKPCGYHGIGPFQLETGRPLITTKKETYSDVFGKTMVQLGKKDHKLVAITAAMPEGTGLQLFAKTYPERFFDVGIAEQHAVTFAAGLAAGGYKPVVAIYSSFLQRSYDQIIHDVCLQNLPVVFAIDRAGIVGADGETHQGIFDLSYLSHIPNLTVMAPKNKSELVEMLTFATNFNGPIAIRYPRGAASEISTEVDTPIVYGQGEMLYIGKSVGIIAIGAMVDIGRQVVENLKKYGIQASLFNARFVKPIDEKQIADMATRHDYLFSLEDNLVSGGFGMKVMETLIKYKMSHIPFHPFGFFDQFIEQGSPDELYQKYQLDANSITEQIITQYEQVKGKVANG
ncbi:MAG: 1-deoxy-D-xylulose-5-phosphate synthase [Epulopiscium sp.]|nr:1-deoxy-D-xylulose-5-phosphate synthase [Candidatus Epulonipiscium sp.]